MMLIKYLGEHGIKINGKVTPKDPQPFLDEPSK